MKSIQEFKIIECEFIPENIDLEKGVLYISREYQTATHLCPCGCGRPIPVMIEFDKGSRNKYSWFVEETDDNKFTFSPSLLNMGCKTHYFIRNNKVIFV